MDNVSIMLLVAGAFIGGIVLGVKIVSDHEEAYLKLVCEGLTNGWPIDSRWDRMMHEAEEAKATKNE